MTWNEASFWFWYLSLLGFLMARCLDYKGEFLVLLFKLVRFPYGYVLGMRQISGSDDIWACEVSQWICSWNKKGLFEPVRFPYSQVLGMFPESLWLWCLILMGLFQVIWWISSNKYSQIYLSECWYNSWPLFLWGNPVLCWFLFTLHLLC